MTDTHAVHISKADHSHLQHVIDLIGACRMDLIGAGINQWDDRYPDSQCVASDLAAGNLYIATIDERLAGAVALNQNQEPEYAEIPWSYPPPALIIHRLCVSPTLQGRGIGSTLMRFAEQHARESRCTSIRLDVYSGNPGAVKLYKRLDYTFVGQIQFPRRSLPFHCMEKAVSQTSEAG